MRFRELRLLAGSQLEEDEERSLAELKEEVKDLDTRERICKHNNEKETAVISLIVLQMQKYLFTVANRTLGPMIVNIRAVLPHILNPDDLVTTGIIHKYQKMSERSTPHSDSVVMTQQIPGKPKGKISASPAPSKNGILKAL